MSKPKAFGSGGAGRTVVATTMKSEIQETVILEMQRKVYDFRDEIKKHETTIASTLEQYNQQESSRAYAMFKLRETLDFLQEFNEDAVKVDWFTDYGFDRDGMLINERSRKLPTTGPFMFHMEQKVKWSGMPNEPFTIIGIQRKEVLIEGDFSQMHNIMQSQWVPISEVKPT